MNRAFLFDFDGTLVNSLPVCRATFSGFLRDLGISNSEGLFDRYNGPTFDEIFSDLVTRFRISIDPLKLSREYQSKLKQAYENVGFNKGVITFCELLRRREYLIGVVSSNSRTVVERLLARHIFDVELIVGAEDVLRGKPAPDPYITALQRLNLHPSAAFAIEDSESGVKAALSAGVGTFAFGDARISDEISAHQRFLGKIGNFAELAEMI